jgi:hypothetical protein
MPTDPKTRDNQHGAPTPTTILAPLPTFHDRVHPPTVIGGQAPPQLAKSELQRIQATNYSAAPEHFVSFTVKRV